MPKMSTKNSWHYYLSFLKLKYKQDLPWWQKDYCLFRHCSRQLISPATDLTTSRSQQMNCRSSYAALMPESVWARSISMEAKRAPGSGAKTESFFSSQDGAKKNYDSMSTFLVFLKKFTYQDTDQKWPHVYPTAIDYMPINHRLPAIFIL